MNSKKKTFLALTVKLLFSVICVHAQNIKDSAKVNDFHFPIAPTNIYFLKQPLTQTLVPGNFYAKQLPFFCSKELQVQKTVGFPIKFRIGSVEYCDRLEGKK